MSTLVKTLIVSVCLALAGMGVGCSKKTAESPSGAAPAPQTETGAEAQENSGATAQETFDEAMRFADLKQWEDAERLFKKAIELDPGFPRPYCGLATVYRNTNRLPEAIELLKKALELDDKYTVAYDNLGLVYMVMGRELKKQGDADADEFLNLAVENFKRAIELEAQYKDAHYNLGQTYAEKGMAEEAVASFNQYISMAPPDDLDARDAKQKIKELTGK